MDAGSPLQPTLADVKDARDRIRGVAWRTPLVPYSRHGDGEIHLKLECLQRNGSFKIRGAWNKMSRLDKADTRRGFVTISAGNHGQAVAWSARRLGAPCTVWVPETAVERKVKAMEALGATVRRKPHGEIMDLMQGDRWRELEGTYVHPFGDHDVIAGQGTIGLEILEDLPQAGTVLVPVGGGGLVSGIATVIRELKPGMNVYGVQAAGAAPLPLSLKSGRVERVPEPKTIADGIAASTTFDYMLPLLQEHLSGCFTVTDDEMRRALRHLAHECHVVAEPAGAAALAAAWKHARGLEPPVVCLVSGGNVDPQLFSDITREGPLPAPHVRAR